MMQSLPAPLVSSEKSWRRMARTGYAVIFLTFGVVGGWAAVTQIDHAIAASGTVTLETNRKTVQHFEGGIVDAISVKEGQSVKAGATLFRLEGTQAKATYDMTRNEFCSYWALEERLIAERDQVETITWPREMSGTCAADGTFYEHVVADQLSAFSKRRMSLVGQISVLDSRIKQLQIQIDGINIVKDSTQKQVDFIVLELNGLRTLSKSSLIPKTRLYSMERERERLEGTIGQSMTDAAKAESTIGEYKAQIQQLREKFQEEVASLLIDTRQKLSDFKQKLAVATDVLRRDNVTAPVAGTVQNLRVFTIGQVVKPGESLLDIVPQGERLNVEVQITPSDIDGVYTGQQAEIRFPAFHSRLIPMMMGRLESVSHDRLVDEGSKQPYFRGIVVLNKAQIPGDVLPRIRAGMPAEVIVASGERTVLSYFISPLTSTLRKAFID